jgi:hypothetical protein
MKNISIALAALAFSTAAQAQPSIVIVPVGGEIVNLPSGYGTNEIVQMPAGCPVVGYQLHLSWWPSSVGFAELLVQAYALTSRAIVITGPQAYVDGPAASLAYRTIIQPTFVPVPPDIGGTPHASYGGSQVFSANFKTNGSTPINESFILPIGAYPIVTVPQGGALALHSDILYGPVAAAQELSVPTDVEWQGEFFCLVGQ